MAPASTHDRKSWDDTPDVSSQLWGVTMVMRSREPEVPSRQLPQNCLRSGYGRGATPDGVLNSGGQRVQNAPFARWELAEPSKPSSQRQPPRFGDAMADVHNRARNISEGTRAYRYPKKLDPTLLLVAALSPCCRSRDAKSPAVTSSARQADAQAADPVYPEPSSRPFEGHHDQIPARSRCYAAL